MTERDNAVEEAQDARATFDLLTRDKGELSAEVLFPVIYHHVY